MNLWQSVKKIFTPPAAESKPVSVALPDIEDEITVEELTPAQVQQVLDGEAPPLLLDVREQYEWEQVRISAALHIAMNSIPDHIEELPRNRNIVVFCAHGSRSYGVAHYLRQQGFDAGNLAGGITQWRIQGGAVEVGKTPR